MNFPYKFSKTNIKFHENPSSGSQAVAKRTDKAKPIVAFRKFWEHG